MGYLIKNQGSGRSPSGTVIPGGVVANQQQHPIPGMLRYNTEILSMEFFNGTEYKQLIASGTSTPLIVDNFVGDGIIQSFQMSQIVSSANQLLVFISGVNQQASLSYNVSTNTDIIGFIIPPPQNSHISIIHNAGTSL